LGERKQAYFDWAAQVGDGLRGVHPTLEAIVDGLRARKSELA
jgi:guanosine-3',5'-bis(diphosphate) 3'-pyrophosphohydrolase